MLHSAANISTYYKNLTAEEDMKEERERENLEE
jgi:hypothetical protein